MTRDELLEIRDKEIKGLREHIDFLSSLIDGLAEMDAEEEVEEQEEDKKRRR